MGRRGDIIRTMHKAIALLPEGRGLQPTAIHDSVRNREPIIGQVVQRGAAGDHHDRRYLIVDGIDGRTHYVDIGIDNLPTPRGSLVKLEPRQIEPRKSDRTIVEIAGANGGRYSVDIHLRHDRNASEDFARAHVRRLEAIRRATGNVERMPDGSWKIAPDHLDRVREYERGRADKSPMTITTLSRISVEKQATLDAPTWLDKELAAHEPMKLAPHGFGKDLNRALYLRQQWLVDQHLADIDGEQLRLRPGTTDALRQREIRTLAGQLSNEMGMGVREAISGERIDGIYRRSVQSASNRFALIEQSREFVLVPWRPEMERHIGQQITGIPRGDSMSWNVGRGRSGPTISL
ncbi:DUF3363 domain-containing protein [Sphingomonas sp. G-3-2-10]|uniref:DUF3363 domain-containing protein n=1 Tax=Sphingomonas sp. G-3-2-10 TaxID=2728838 RepID=UPI001F0FC27F|nr:DUF3363 domain-containing protein [Sphingomonas sp. G-3-2-10]